LDKLPPWTENITIESLPNEDLKTLATLLDLNAVIILMETLPGVTIAIPKKANHKYKLQYVLQHYDGTKKTRMQLARLCGFSENYIYKIVRNRNKIL